ncbi:Integrase, catalytic domain-containing protein [Azotobacter vinelandii CA]|uniref:Integrase, catalytic domain-containing protein n=2 Tax=Azotobacter vinelandii TaxID=354 RepID=C1DPC9_AZOVD|nr:IS481-like element ISAzvi11 family transposase [Azotobacter vinelandii]ACO77361.1 Integrase, catalytic domain-containing protein [Azotobacter vinelandii DJ]ACO77794.1 Integrase, catalytic domain-containing protein [Azotobacter vinelandii DJ]AGK15279.1 Integrase, catalytic domain-containing protein [Azotobacter vinelandii CA]AGK15402.1 Integrase, catalytic domain-containing protein [Azotobacter vinelandii CA]AGK19746.1 Integrase, catalytic domain-containing protein [Azotobacter vinelandii CA
MPWNIQDTMNLREEFVLLAQQEGSNRRELCRRFGISPQTAYKWLVRYEQQGRAGLADLSRRPKTSPHLTSPSLEARVVELRQAHPCWGGRKLSRRLQDLGHPALAPSTITSILHRHGLIDPLASEAAVPWKRFEHAAPNDLWQMDFKGYFQTSEGPCHPLTVLDDHSRFNLGLRACACQRHGTVQGELIGIFERYGLPVRINTDNGAPWGASRQPGQLTELAIWLIRLGIRLSFSRPRHPQTNGKDERFHRSLKAEVLNGRSFHTLHQAQEAFDNWRVVYNHQRPHEALRMVTPVTRYRVSPRTYPVQLPTIEYGPDDTVVTVKALGAIRFKGRSYKLSNPLRDQPVAIRPSGDTDGLYDVYFVHHKLVQIDLRELAKTDA